MRNARIRLILLRLLFASGLAAIVVALCVVSVTTLDALGVKVEAAEAAEVWGGEGVPPPTYCAWHRLVPLGKCNRIVLDYCTGTYYNCASRRCGYVCPGADNLGPAPPQNYWGLAYFDPPIDCPLAWERGCAENVYTHQCVCIDLGGAWVLCDPDPADLNTNCLIWYL